MRHRLPLSEGPLAANEHVFRGPRCALPWPGIAIADTARGLDALSFALELAEAATALGVSVRFNLLDFAHAPAPDASLRARLSQAGSLRALRVEEQGIAASVEAGALDLWVGTPALAALEPAFGILLGTARARLEWPAALRSAAPQLALASARPGLAHALLAVLEQRGFLPVRSHGVR